MSERTTQKPGPKPHPEGPRCRVTTSIRRRTYDALVEVARKEHRHSLSDMVRVILEDVLDDDRARAQLIG